LVAGLDKRVHLGILQTTGRLLPLVAEEPSITQHDHSFLIFLQGCLEVIGIVKKSMPGLTFQSPVAASKTLVLLIHISPLSAL
jgi:hypothetical protein